MPKNILIPSPMMGMITAQLEKAFTCHKLYEAQDAEKMLQEIAPKIDLIATGGLKKLDGAFLAQFNNLKQISSFGVGYDSIDAEWCGKHGIIVTNTPNVLTEEVADTALALLLCTIKELYVQEKYLRDGLWLKGAPKLTRTLRDRKVGIVGLGRIGKAIAKRLEAFGLSVVYHNRSIATDVSYPYFASLTEMAKEVNVLLSVLPGGASTHHLINAEVLKNLGADGILINIGRGSVVDETALIKALQDKTIATAGLDVFEFEPKVPQALLDMEHITLFPHIGSSTFHTRDAMGQLVVDNLLAFKAGKKPLTPVAETPVN